MSSHFPQRRRVKSLRPRHYERSAILRHIANNDGADMRRSRRWRCRRSLIADCLKARGWTILHITGMGQTKAHPCTSPAIIVGNQVIYTQPSGKKWEPSDPQPISMLASTSPSRKYG
jgi:hhH-GPD domain protein